MVRPQPAPPQRPPARKPEEPNRRGELIRVAGRLFREKGYEATTVRDIAAAVGMRSGSPFYHFKSKQEMLKAVMLEGLARALEHLALAASGQHDARAAFHAMVRAHLSTILEPGADFIPVLLYEWRSLSDESRAEVIALKDRYEALWQEVLDDLAREALVPRAGSLTRLFVFGALNWVAQWYRPGGGADLDAIADAATEFCLRPPAPRSAAARKRRDTAR